MNLPKQVRRLLSGLIINGLLICFVCQPVFAASATSGNGKNGSQPLITPEQIEVGRQAAESDATLDESRKQKTLELYDQAMQWLQQAQAVKTELSQLKALLAEAPGRIEAIRTGKAKAALDLVGLKPILASDDLERIEQALSQEQQALQEATDSQRQQADRLSQLLTGSLELSEEIAAKVKRIEQIDAEIQAVATADLSTLEKARGMLLKARKSLRQTELELLRLRLDNRDLLTNLAQNLRDFAAAEITLRQPRVDSLRQALQQLRESRTQQAREEAEAIKAETESLPPALRSLVEENARYRLEHQELVGREESVVAALQKTKLRLDEIKSDFDRTRQRVEVVGPTEAIGKLLKRRRDALPSAQSYRRTSAQRSAEISRATDRQIEIDELLRELGNRDMEVAASLQALPEGELQVLEQKAEETLRGQRNALNDLQKFYGRYIGQITSLDLAERQLLEVAVAYIDYIDDQLIWIPGPGLASLLDPKGFAEALVWLLSPTHWAELAQDGWSLLKKRTLPLLLIMLLLLALLARHRKAKQKLQAIALETHKIRTDSFRLTLKAILYSLAAVGPWPLLLLGIGGLLASLPTASLYSLSMANGLIRMGLLLGGILFLIQINLANGLGDRHLRWPQAIRKSLVRELYWILPLVVPLGFVIGVTAGTEPPQAVQSFGRLAFIAFMAVSAIFTFRLLRRGGAIMQSLAAGSGGPMLQLHFLWFPLLMIIPLALSLTSALGYHYAALHLEYRAEQTFWFFFALFLFKELLLRSLYIAERRLRFEDALHRREELRIQRLQTEESKEEESALISLEIPELDFEELGEQNKRLVRAGFLFGAVIGIWSIWSDLLPALGFLYSTELPLHASRIVDGISKEVPVTLGDLAVGLVIAVVTILAAKNIPGVLEIALLQRLPLDPGARYAITSLSRYLIAGIGVFAAFSTLGLQWSNIQWLVAALSVGLGFGLQEIVANFISGIILLFERPIRVGDVVTIDNTTGKVSRIRIRATTITNWDKQELLIPNKEFITGRVINWTLTDKINRIVIIVGVAYGTDVQKAMDLMLEAAMENSEVLDDPKPVASFEAFGDNALTLQLRSYLGSMDNRLATITALHKAINEKFIAANIDIAFPQRDIHLQTTEPLDVRLHREPAGVKAGDSAV